MKKTIQNILINWRNFLEPLLMYHNVWPYDGIREPEFGEKIFYWNRECLDTTHEGLDALLVLDKNEVKEKRGVEEYIQRHKDEILNFVMSNFDEDTGGFRQCANAEPTVYGSYAAICVLRHLAGVRHYEERLGYERAKEYIGEERIKKTIDFIKRSQCPKKGGFYEDPNRHYRPTVNRTNSAFFALWNLEREDLVKEGVKKFLYDCVKPSTNGDGKKDLIGSGDKIGFVESPDEEEPLVCSTFYGLHVMEKVDKEWVRKHFYELCNFIESCKKEEKTPKEVDEKWVKKHPSQASAKIIELRAEIAKSCEIKEISIPKEVDEEWVKKATAFINNYKLKIEGRCGFSWAPNNPSNLIHTSLALMSLKILERAGITGILDSRTLALEFIGVDSQHVCNYIKDCKSDGGFRFKHKSWILKFFHGPNMYILRNMVRIFEEYKDKCPGMKELYVEATKEAKQIIYNLSLKRNGVFAGYFFNRSGILEKVSSFLFERLASFFLSPRNISKKWTPVHFFLPCIIAIPLMIFGFWAAKLSPNLAFPAFCLGSCSVAFMLVGVGEFIVWKYLR